jgi:hypothetical protein
VLGVVKMLGGVLILGRIAASGMSADQAHAEVNPRIACLYAVLADMLGGLPDFDLIQVSALFWHGFLRGL